MEIFLFHRKETDPEKEQWGKLLKRIKVNDRDEIFVNPDPSVKYWLEAGKLKEALELKQQEEDPGEWIKKEFNHWVRTVRQERQSNIIIALSAAKNEKDEWYLLPDRSIWKPFAVQYTFPELDKDKNEFVNFIKNDPNKDKPDDPKKPVDDDDGENLAAKQWLNEQFNGGFKLFPH